MEAETNQKIINYLKKYDPGNIGKFGSVARGEDSESSDIDILVNFNCSITLFDLGGIKQDLLVLLKRPVDYILERSLNKKLKRYILKDLKVIFE